MNAHAEFTTEPDDILTAARMHGKQRSQRLAALAGVGVLCFLVFDRAGWSVHSDDLPYLATCAAVAVALILIIQEWGLRRAAEKAPKKKVEIDLTEEGIELKSCSPPLKEKWEVLKKVSLDHRGLMLYVTNDLFVFVPARAFRGGYPRTELKEFFKRKLRHA